MTPRWSTHNTPHRSTAQHEGSTVDPRELASNAWPDMQRMNVVPGETTAMGCMQLNQVAALTEIKLNLQDDEAWMEVIMGQGDLVEPHSTMGDISQESWQKARQVCLSP